jgi:hypothetical protein
MAAKSQSVPGEKKIEDDRMTGKNARAISSTERIMGSDTVCEFSIRGLTERVLRFFPVSGIDSRIVDFSKPEAGLINEVADAAVNPILTAEQLVITKDSADSRAHAVSAFAQALRQVSPGELHHFELAADMLVTYDSQNELSEFFRECSILAAMIARDIAYGPNSVSTDKAFLSGLLSEIGALACLKVDTFCFQSIWNHSGGLPVRRAELEIAQYSGTTHELGSNLLIRNGLPSDVSEAIGTRVNEETKTRDPLARIAAFSRTVAAELIRCTQRKHEQNLIGTLPKFGAYFDLNIDRELLANPSITPFLRRGTE